MNENVHTDFLQYSGNLAAVYSSKWIFNLAGVIV